MELLIQVSHDPDRVTVHDIGDVIVAMPDGHHWGKEELNHPHWRIVRVPSMSQHEAESIVAGEPPTYPTQQGLRLRQFSVDVDALALLDTERIPHRGHGASVELTADHNAFRQALSLKSRVS